MRVLVVHRGSLRDLNANCGEELKARDVVVFSYPLSGGEACGSVEDLCCVQLRPKQVAEVQCALSPSGETAIFRRFKGSLDEILAWISGTPLLTAAEGDAIAVSEPSSWPGYRRFITDSLTNAERTIVAVNALNRADKVPSSGDTYAKRFPGFIVGAMAAFSRIVASVGELDSAAEFLHEPAIEYAPTGGNFEAAYRCPFSGAARTTKRHLKPRIERRGYYSPEYKPRLYFDVLKHPDDGRQWVIVLYFGPHPKPGTNNEFEVRLPTGG